MKTFVVAALLGLVTLSGEVSALQKWEPRQFVQESSDSSDSSSSSDTDLEVNEDDPATKWNKKNPHPGYPANHDDFQGEEGLGHYVRKVPHNF